MEPFDLLEEIEKEAEERGRRIQGGQAESRFDGMEERRDPGILRTIGSAFDNENTVPVLNRVLRQNRYANSGPRIDADAVIASNPEYQERLARLPEEYNETVREARTEAELEFILRSGEERLRNAETLQAGGLGQSILSYMAVGMVDPVDAVVTLTTGGLGGAVAGANRVRKGIAGGVAAGTSNFAVETLIDDPTRDGTDQVAAFALGFGIGGILNMRGGGRTDTTPEAQQLTVAIERGIREAAPPRPQPVGEGVAVAAVKELFPGVRVTSNYRGPDHALSRKNPRSYHARTHAAVDVAPIPGVTFDEFVNRLRGAGYTILEAINETGKGRTRHATGDHWHVVLGTPGGKPVDAAPVSVPQLDPQAFQRVDRMFQQALVNDPNRFDLGDQLFDFTPGAASAGAAARQVEDVEYFGTKFLLPGAYGKLLDRSVPRDIRGLASELIAGTSRVDDQTRQIAAEEISASLERSWRSQNYMAYNQYFNEWRKERGIGLVRADLTSGPQQQFMREVYYAALGDTSVSPQAIKAKEAFADSYEQILRKAKEVDLEDFRDIPFDRNYVPRKASPSKWMELRNQIGAAGVQAILRQAMIAKGMDPELATRIARAYDEGTVDRITYRKVDNFVGPSDDSIERLRYYLPDDDPELVDDVISHLKQFRKEGNADAGRISEARYRIDMDLLTEVSINGQTFRAADLFEDNAAALFEGYARTMSGWVALAERAGIRSQNDWDIRLKEAVKGNEGNPATQMHIKRLTEIRDLILGRSISNEDGALRRSGQAFMKLNFATSMGQAGMASIAEAGNIVAHMGLRNAMAHMPVLREIFAGARNGDLDAAFTDELRSIFGVGMRTKLSRGRAGYDEFGNELGIKLADSVDRILDPMARGVGYAGLIAPVNDYLQLLASKSFLQKLANVATGRNTFSAADVARLRDAGFEDGVLERVLKSIRENGTFDGKRLVGLNAEKWDRDLLAQLQYSTDRMVYRAVQENDIGSSTWWMHTLLGRMLTQFRSFIFNAYTKQTLHALRFRDRQSFAALMLTTTFGGLAWLARTYVNTSTDEEQRKKLLTPERLATAAMSATGYASILPTVIDTGMVQSGNDPLFSHVRTTGLSTSILQGSPVVATTDNLASTATLPLRVVRDDYDFSQDDLKKITRLLPFNNVTGIRNAIDLMEEELPRRSREDDYRQ